MYKSDKKLSANSFRIAKFVNLPLQATRSTRIQPDDPVRDRHYAEIRCQHDPAAVCMSWRKERGNRQQDHSWRQRPQVPPQVGGQVALPLTSGMDEIDGLKRNVPDKKVLMTLAESAKEYKE